MSKCEDVTKEQSEYFENLWKKDPMFFMKCKPISYDKFKFNNKNKSTLTKKIYYTVNRGILTKE